MEFDLDDSSCPVGPGLFQLGSVAVCSWQKKSHSVWHLKTIILEFKNQSETTYGDVIHIIHSHPHFELTGEVACVCEQDCDFYHQKSDFFGKKVIFFIKIIFCLAFIVM